MSQSSRLATALVLLSLLVLGTMCGSPPSPNPAYPGPEPTREPPPLSLVPTRPAFKPTVTPAPSPTNTPLPTAVSLPQSAFDVLWVEHECIKSSERCTGVVWWADPRDIASRREVTRLEDEIIDLAVLSPDGHRIALGTRSQVQGGGPLWVVNLDGTDLRPLVSDVVARQILWSPNSHLVFYDVDGDEWTGIERINVASGERQRILTVEPPTSLRILGWSAGGQWLYYIRSTLEGYELWKVRNDGSTSQVIRSLGPDIPLSAGTLLSPNGSKLLLNTREGLYWLSTEGQGRGSIPLSQPEGGYPAVWGDGENEVIVGWASGWLYHLEAINIQSQQSRELATFDIPAGPGWDQLALSPDHHWLMSHIYQAGHYWIHLPTGTIILVSHQEYGVHFIAWIPRGAGQ